MGKLIDSLRARRPNVAAKLPAGGSKAPRSADWLLAKHRADQGLGEAPADDMAGAAPVGETAIAPPGGMTDDFEELRRKRAGIQL